MPESVTHLAERLRVEGQKSADFFASLPEQAWDVLIYTDGADWTLDQILAHFASSEASLGLLIDQILEGKPGAPEDFDLNRFNHSQVTKLKHVSRQDLLARYRTSRDENIYRVLHLQPADLERQGRHPFLGVTSLVEIIKMIYRHNQIHQREIRQVFANLNFQATSDGLQGDEV